VRVSEEKDGRSERLSFVLGRRVEVDEVESHDDVEDDESGREDVGDEGADPKLKFGENSDGVEA